ncbi:M23/M56 family metallopeptidase [Ruminococcaceae bacterium OttesenSCG-928-I18]|nr:M23/M56 family metallopeptidase [Ruminococcaceae bacterium OttesenSCG-928-I18]
MIEFYARFLLPAALAGSLATTILLLFRPLWVKLRPGFGKVALLLCTLLFLFPFFLPGQSLAKAQVLPSTQAQTDPAVVSSVGEGQDGFLAGIRPAFQTTTVVENAPGAFPPISLPHVVCTLHLSGLLFFSLLYLLRTVRFHSALSKTLSKVRHEESLTLYGTLCEEYGLKRPPALFESPALRSPVLLGLFRPRIVLPDKNVPMQTAEYALRHELAHCRKRDLPLRFLFQLTCLLHWWNPLAYLLRNLFVECCESACDEYATRGMTGRGKRSYAEALLYFADDSPSVPAAFGFSRPAKRLKKRLTLLLTPHKRRKTPHTVGTLLLALATAACLFVGCAAAAESQTLSQSTPEGSSMDEVLEVSSQSASVPGASETPASSVPVSSAPMPSGAADPPSSQRGADPNLLLWPVPDYTDVGRGLDESHRGLDIKAERGASILAIDAGQVIVANHHYSYGNYIVVAQGEGIYTLYAHCEELFVQKDDLVEKGQAIATVGDSGNSAGCLLHLEIQENDTLLDPLELLETPVPAHNV